MATQPIATANLVSLVRHSEPEWRSLYRGEGLSAIKWQLVPLSVATKRAA
jgi:hypothetical protein